MNNNRTTELLRKLLDERGVEWRETINHANCIFTWWESPTFGTVHAMDNEDGETLFMACLNNCDFTPEQAIAATLGKPKAKSHPYGYEPDTGAYDCTRCECGCINDISATYCNNCGGEIEIDENAEKEIYHCPRHLVFAEKHDDGSLEFDGKRYIAATQGSETCEFTPTSDDPPTCSNCGWQADAYDCDWLDGGAYEYDGRFCKNCGALVRRAVER